MTGTCEYAAPVNPFSLHFDVSEIGILIMAPYAAFVDSCDPHSEVCVRSSYIVPSFLDTCPFRLSIKDDLYCATRAET